jgi:hypothetical protein
MSVSLLVVLPRAFAEGFDAFEGKRNAAENSKQANRKTAE